MNIRPRKTAKDEPDKLHRRLLPFYMRPFILIAFMVTSLVGQLTWTTIPVVPLGLRGVWLRFFYTPIAPLGL